MTKDQLRQFLKAHQVRHPQDLFRDCVTSHGPPLFRSEKTLSPVRLNEPFWAEYLAGERIVIYERGENTFYAYNAANGLYESISAQALKHHLSDLLEVAEDRKWAGCYQIKKLNSDGNRRSIIELLRGKIEQHNFFSNRPVSIHCSNTMIVFEHGKIVVTPFSPEFRSRNQSPILYDAGARHPEFTKAFFTGRMKEDDAQLIQKYYGQCLLGRNLSQTLLIFDGVADSSKTTLARVIAELVGQQSCTELRTSQLEERFETSSFIGKTLLLAPDVAANFLSRYGASVIKRLVGTDLMSAEFKRVNARIAFEGVFNIVITSNSRLRARCEGDNDAWSRRIKIVRFEEALNGERISDFHKVIVGKEGPGILNFAIEGVKSLLSDLATFGRIKTSREQDGRVRKFVDESDSLRIFLKTNLCATTDSAHDVTINEVLDSYYEHCVANDLNSLPTKEARKDLDELMREIFGRSQSNSLKRDAKAQRGFSQMKWREPEDED